MIEALKSLGTGFVVGLIFATVKLPIPAPQVLAGITGIIGLWLGYMAYGLLINRFRI